MKVINMNGTEINYEAAFELMDVEILYRLSAGNYKTEQEFFTAYEKAHERKYGEWELSKQNPCY